MKKILNDHTMDHDEINKKITAAMESLDGISKATPAPYLLTRINARMQKEGAPNFWSRAGVVLSRPKVAGLGLAAFIMVNFFVANSLRKETASASLTTTASPNPKYDFAINVSSIYDIENQEP